MTVRSRWHTRVRPLAVLAVLVLLLAACADLPGAIGELDAPGAGDAGTNDDAAADATPPASADTEDTSQPDRVVGDGTAASCTSDALVAAVAAGGVITFDCGDGPATITMQRTAKVRNDAGDVVIDGGGTVTLSGAGRRRILYMNTCDAAQAITSSRCDRQTEPHLTVQNLAFVDGDATDAPVLDGMGGGGGGAMFVRGGSLKIVNSQFRRNRCAPTGPDLGGAAVRVVLQAGDPVHIAGSVFGGAADQANVCANGGAISGLHASFEIVDSVISHNDAVGNGANPARAGTPGGGSGGAIYMDGNEIALDVVGSRIEHNHANEGGGAVFFVSNNGTGTMAIRDSVLRDNPSDGFETAGLPGIFHKSGPQPDTSGSTIE